MYLCRYNKIGCVAKLIPISFCDSRNNVILAPIFLNICKLSSVLNAIQRGDNNTRDDVQYGVYIRRILY